MIRHGVETWQPNQAQVFGKNGHDCLKKVFGLSSKFLKKPMSNSKKYYSFINEFQILNFMLLERRHDWLGFNEILFLLYLLNVLIH